MLILCCEELSCCSSLIANKKLEASLFHLYPSLLAGGGLLGLHQNTKKNLIVNQPLHKSLVDLLINEVCEVIKRKYRSL